MNEVLSHSDQPLEDAIEFYNPTSLAVNIGGWFVSNSADDLKKYRVAGNTLIQGRSFRVLYEYQFNPADGSSVPFTLNSAHGDQVYLSQADAAGNLTGYRAATGFGPAGNGVSFGRHTNSIGQVDFVPLRARTFGMDNPATVEQFRTGTGAVNAYPLVGPVVINEIMFYPPLNGVEDDTQNEYVELLNITGADVLLYDPLATTNTWEVKGDIEFTFPPDVTLPAGATLLLVNFDPSTDELAANSFRARYGLTAGVRLFGPYGKNLSNSGNPIGLCRSDTPQAAPHPDAGFVPYLLVEQVNFSSTAPWPVGADGTGSSLQRLTAGSFGNDPANWFVAAATAGRPNSAGPDDANGDGLPDAWQIQYFGSIISPNAAPGADPDHDGFSNFQEYLAGTNPIDANSALKFDDAEVVGASTVLHFRAVAGKSYTILYKQSLTSGTWLNLTNLPTQSVSGPTSITDPTSAGGVSRFYRLATPAL